MTRTATHLNHHLPERGGRERERESEMVSVREREGGAYFRRLHFMQGTLWMLSLIWRRMARSRDSHATHWKLMFGYMGRNRQLIILLNHHSTELANW